MYYTVHYVCIDTCLTCLTYLPKKKGLWDAQGHHPHEVMYLLESLGAWPQPSFPPTGACRRNLLSAMQQIHYNYLYYLYVDHVIHISINHTLTPIVRTVGPVRMQGEPKPNVEGFLGSPPPWISNPMWCQWGQIPLFVCSFFCLFCMSHA